MMANIKQNISNCYISQRPIIRGTKNQIRKYILKLLSPNLSQVKIFQEDAKEDKMGRTELATTTVPTVITELNQVGPGAVVDFCWLLVLYILLRFVSKLLTPLLVTSTSAIARSTLSVLKATFPETEYARRRRQYALPFLVNSEEGLRLTVAIFKAITD